MSATRKGETKSIVGSILFLLFLAGVAVAAIIGWVLNIVALFSATGLGEIAVRIAGIFIAPLGAVAGYF